jgi:hypothetical protein
MIRFKVRKLSDMAMNFQSNDRGLAEAGYNLNLSGSDLQ